MAHANGGCYVCRRGDSLVDFDVQIVGEGALAVCASCVKDAAEAAGLTFNEALVRELRAEIQRLDASNIERLEAELAEARAALADEQRLAARLQDALARPAASKAKAAASA